MKTTELFYVEVTDTFGGEANYSWVSRFLVKSVSMLGAVRKVCRIFDMGADSFDRYTIAFKGYRLANRGMVYPYLASSVNPFHPQGFGQYGEFTVFMTGRHLGKRVSFDAMPDQVKKFILQNI